MPSQSGIDFYLSSLCWNRLARWISFSYMLLSKTRLSSSACSETLHKFAPVVVKDNWINEINYYQNNRKMQSRNDCLFFFLFLKVFWTSDSQSGILVSQKVPGVVAQLIFIMQKHIHMSAEHLNTTCCFCGCMETS